MARLTPTVAAAGDLDTTDLVYLSTEGHRENYRSKLNAGDIVVVRTGAAGNACVVPDSLDGANCIDVLIVRRTQYIAPSFLEHVLNSDWTQRQIEQHSVGSIQSHFNVSALKALRVPRAPLAIQQKVAESLEAASARDRALRERIARQVELLREHRQALVTAAVSGQMSVPGVAA